jgi:leucyl aminopeptidase (aminopeptidase T)
LFFSSTLFYYKYEQQFHQKGECMNMFTELMNAAKNALHSCLKVKSSESVLIVTDPPLVNIGQAFYNAASEITSDVLLVQMPVGKYNGEEPPEKVSELMCRFDVVIAPTSRSLTHTNARRQACQAGARVGTLPGITEDIMIRTLSADYDQIAERTYRLKKLLEKATEVKITTALGTDITLPVKGQKVIASTGIVDKPGTFGNLPSGEAYLTPIEGKTNGIFVVDASMAGIGKIQDKPITIRVENGMAVEITGGKEAGLLLEQIEKIGEKARNIAELGIGTNDRAIVSGLILEDEKVMGTVHIALGNNLSMGGTVDVPFHVDGILLKPNVWVDDYQLLREGELSLP